MNSWLSWSICATALTCLLLVKSSGATSCHGCGQRAAREECERHFCDQCCKRVDAASRGCARHRAQCRTLACVNSRQQEACGYCSLCCPARRKGWCSVHSDATSCHRCDLLAARDGCERLFCDPCCKTVDVAGRDCALHRSQCHTLVCANSCQHDACDYCSLCCSKRRKGWCSVHSDATSCHRCDQRAAREECERHFCDQCCKRVDVAGHGCARHRAQCRTLVCANSREHDACDYCSLCCSKPGKGWCSVHSDATSCHRCDRLAARDGCERLFCDPCCKTVDAAGRDCALHRSQCRRCGNFGDAAKCDFGLCLTCCKAHDSAGVCDAHGSLCRSQSCPDKRRAAKCKHLLCKDCCESKRSQDRTIAPRWCAAHSAARLCRWCDKTVRDKRCVSSMCGACCKTLYQSNSVAYTSCLLHEKQCSSIQCVRLGAKRCVNDQCKPCCDDAWCEAHGDPDLCRGCGHGAPVDYDRGCTFKLCDACCQQDPKRKCKRHPRACSFCGRRTRKDGKERGCFLSACAKCCTKHRDDSDDCPAHDRTWFGFYKCPKCRNRRWASPYAALGWTQQCKGCKTPTYPNAVKEHSGGAAHDNKRPHQRSLCARCRAGTCPVQGAWND